MFASASPSFVRDHQDYTKSLKAIFMKPWTRPTASENPFKFGVDTVQNGRLAATWRYHYCISITCNMEAPYVVNVDEN